MTALARFCDIVHTIIYLLTCWLAGNCHIIADYNWSVRSIGRIVDELEMALEAIEEEGDLIIKEEFMMIIFHGIMYEIPLF